MRRDWRQPTVRRASSGLMESLDSSNESTTSGILDTGLLRGDEATDQQGISNTDCKDLHRSTNGDTESGRIARNYEKRQYHWLLALQFWALQLSCTTTGRSRNHITWSTAITRSIEVPLDRSSHPACELMQQASRIAA